MSEREAWEAWERGESRCPYCVRLDDRDFEAICDCSRLSLEKHGVPVTIMVAGNPETAQTVMPHTIRAAGGQQPHPSPEADLKG